MINVYAFALKRQGSIEKTGWKIGIVRQPNAEQMISGFPIDGAMGGSGGGRVR